MSADRDSAIINDLAVALNTYFRVHARPLLLRALDDKSACRDQVEAAIVVHAAHLIVSLACARADAGDERGEALDTVAAMRRMVSATDYRAYREAIRLGRTGLPS